MIRYASGPSTTSWSFWLEVPSGDARVDVALFVKHLEATEVIEWAVKQLAPWVSSAAVTAYQSAWVF
jgi:hypothetical protein